jgi:hypothetical protein
MTTQINSQSSNASVSARKFNPVFAINLVGYGLGFAFALLAVWGAITSNFTRIVAGVVGMGGSAIATEVVVAQVDNRKRQQKLLDEKTATIAAQTTQMETQATQLGTLEDTVYRLEQRLRGLERGSVQVQSEAVTTALEQVQSAVSNFDNVYAGLERAKRWEESAFEDGVNAKAALRNLLNPEDTTNNGMGSEEEFDFEDLFGFGNLGNPFGSAYSPLSGYSVFGASVNGQTVLRYPGESTDEFVKRLLLSLITENSAESEQPTSDFEVPEEEVQTETEGQQPQA